jgi:DNA-binding LacI/PurR family transcriptional regulator
MKRSLPHRIALSILSEYLETGYLKAGDRLPPVRTLEQRYSVSRNTILQALSLLEQQGYLHRKHGAGVFVAGQSPSPQRGASLIGFVGPNVYADLMLRVYGGIEQVARLQQMHVVVGSTGNDYDLERWQIARMVELGCQAIVLFPCTRTEQVAALSSGWQLVEIGAKVEFEVDGCSVFAERYRGTAQRRHRYPLSKNGRDGIAPDVQYLLSALGDTV